MLRFLTNFALLILPEYLSFLLFLPLLCCSPSLSSSTIFFPLSIYRVEVFCRCVHPLHSSSGKNAIPGEPWRVTLGSSSRCNAAGWPITGIKPCIISRFSGNREQGKGGTNKGRKAEVFHTRGRSFAGTRYASRSWWRLWWCLAGGSVSTISHFRQLSLGLFVCIKPRT